ncbi:hypothetical protein AB1Y20_016982 [Prymnesium parvum]|uniref:Uncharacterized protein n=1 Tax=Prymnesium parvum TaxID=97485 RepID=A0AB34I7I2_PRYPA
MGEGEATRPVPFSHRLTFTDRASCQCCLSTRLPSIAHSSPPRPTPRNLLVRRARCWMPHAHSSSAVRVQQQRARRSSTLRGVGRGGEEGGGHASAADFDA